MPSSKTTPFFTEMIPSQSAWGYPAATPWSFFPSWSRIRLTKAAALPRTPVLLQGSAKVWTSAFSRALKNPS